MFSYAVEYADMYQTFVNGWLVTASDEMMMLKWLNVSKCAKPFLNFWIPLNDAQVLIFIPETGWVEVLQPTQLSIFVKTQAFHQHFDPKSTPVGRLSPAASTSEGGPGSHLERVCSGRWRVLGFSIYIYMYLYICVYIHMCISIHTITYYMYVETNVPTNTSVLDFKGLHLRKWWVFPLK